MAPFTPHLVAGRKSLLDQLMPFAKWDWGRVGGGGVARGKGLDPALAVPRLCPKSFSWWFPLLGCSAFPRCRGTNAELLLKGGFGGGKS